MKETLETDSGKLFGDLAKALDEALSGGPPTIFLGFAFGAIIAAEVGSRLREQPRLVVAVSSEGPTFRGRAATSHRELDATAFEAMLEAKKGTEFILKGGDAMKKMYLPVVKADIALEETYAPPEAPILACPVVAYVGRKPGKDFEETTVSEADAALWLDATTAKDASRVVAFEDDWYILLHAEDCGRIVGDVAAFDVTAAPAAAEPAPSGGYGAIKVTPLGKKEDVALSTFGKRVHVVVNTASKCGMTPQLGGFQKLADEIPGCQVLGFPCNQFHKQEPGDDAAIAEFYASKYGVTFPLFAKGDVNGDAAHPLFAFLKAATAGQAVPVPPWSKAGLPADDVQWNFTKWLVVDGKPTRRYSYDVAPDKIAPDVRAALGE